MLVEANPTEGWTAVYPFIETPWNMWSGDFTVSQISGYCERQSCIHLCGKPNQVRLSESFKRFLWVLWLSSHFHRPPLQTFDGYTSRVNKQSSQSVESALQVERACLMGKKNTLKHPNPVGKTQLLRKKHTNFLPTKYESNHLRATSEEEQTEGGNTWTQPP